MQPGRTESESPLQEYTFRDWTVRWKNSHILPSKCTQPCREQSPCSYCFYTGELKLAHLPEMVYPENRLEIVHSGGGSIVFSPLEALRAVKPDNNTVKIACAEDWRRARESSGLVDRTVGEFDWTFSSDYRGTLAGWQRIADTTDRIDTEALKKRENILIFRDVTLFEDELHDNGISLSSVRIRVMPSGFFTLLRHFLRVDGVIVSMSDTRYYHSFATDYVLMESSRREAKLSEHKIPFDLMNEPDQLAFLLPRLNVRCQKLMLPSDVK